MPLQPLKDLSLVDFLAQVGAITGMPRAPATSLSSLKGNKMSSLHSSPITSTAPFLNSWRHEDRDALFTLGLSMPMQTHPWLDALTHQLQNNSSLQIEFMKMQSIGLLDKKTTPPFKARFNISIPTTPILSVSPNVLDNSESPCRLKERQCIEAPPAYLQQMLMLAYAGVLSATSQPPLPPFPNARFES